MGPAAVDVAVLTVASGADFATTRYGLRACPACREINPLQSEPALAIATKAAGVAAVALGCEKLRRDGHGRWAKGLRWGVAALWLGLAGHNVVTAERYRRR